jgi:hypothetical protein
MSFLRTHLLQGSKQSRCTRVEYVMSGPTSRIMQRRQAGREAEGIARVAERLRQQFPEVNPDALDEVLRGHYKRFDGRPVRDFVPILVERGNSRRPSGWPPTSASWVGAQRRPRSVIAPTASRCRSDRVASGHLYASRGLIAAALG